MHKILVIRIYFLLDALHVSDSKFISCRVQLVYSCLCGYNHITARRVVSAYTECDVQLINLLLMMD
jgi:hypothetical protein